MNVFKRILSASLAAILLAGLSGGVFFYLRLRAYRAEYRQALDLSDAVVRCITLDRPVCTLPRLNYLNDYEHVLDVRFTGLYHWLDTAEDSSLVMIGMLPRDRDTYAVAEGRWYGALHECCLNRPYYDALLADPTSGFTGIGDSITVAEPVLKISSYPRVRTFTVTGIVDDEKQYADSGVYGKYHIYASIDDISVFFIDYSFQSNNYPAYDYAMYNPAQVKYASGVFAIRQDPGGQWKYRTQDGEILDRDGYGRLLESAAINAGFSVEIQLDSSEAVEEFIRTLEEPDPRELPTVANQLAQRRAVLEKTGLGALPEYMLALEATGEAEEWYVFTQKRLVQPVLQDTSALSAEYEPLLRRSCVLAILCSAAALASLAVLIMMNIRRKEGAPHV